MATKKKKLTKTDKSKTVKTKKVNPKKTSTRDGGGDTPKPPKWP